MIFIKLSVAASRKYLIILQICCLVCFLSAHMNRVNSVIFSLENEWLLSVGRDKYLQWHDCTTGKRLGGYQTGAWCTSLKYPLSLLQNRLYRIILIYSPKDCTNRKRWHTV